MVGNVTQAAEGETIKLRAVVEEGYEVAYVEAHNGDGNQIDFLPVLSLEYDYAFKMPAADVEVVMMVSETQDVKISLIGMIEGEIPLTLTGEMNNLHGFGDGVSVPVRTGETNTSTNIQCSSSKYYVPEDYVVSFDYSSDGITNVTPAGIMVEGVNENGSDSYKIYVPMQKAPTYNINLGENADKLIAQKVTSGTIDEGNLTAVAGETVTLGLVSEVGYTITGAKIYAGDVMSEVPFNNNGVIGIRTIFFPMPASDVRIDFEVEEWTEDILQMFTLKDEDGKVQPITEPISTGVAYTAYLLDQPLTVSWVLITEDGQETTETVNGAIKVDEKYAGGYEGKKLYALCMSMTDSIPVGMLLIEVKQNIAGDDDNTGNGGLPTYWPVVDETTVGAAAKDEYVVLCRNLSVRAGAGTEFARIGTLKRGQSVSGEDMGNGWIKIQYNGETAYVSAQYMEAVDAEEAVDQTVAVICRKLNVRAGAGTGYKKLGSVTRGEALKVVAEQNGWYKIVYGDGYAWVCAKYVG